MKQSFRNTRYSSFSLAELLVLLGVIVILALFLLTGSNPQLHAALRAKAQVMANQIETACMAYYNDYGAYPIPTNAPAGKQFTYGIHDTND